LTQPWLQFNPYADIFIIITDKPPRFIVNLNEQRPVSHDSIVCIQFLKKKTEPSRRKSFPLHILEVHGSYLGDDKPISTEASCCFPQPLQTNAGTAPQNRRLDLPSAFLRIR